MRHRHRTLHGGRAARNRRDVQEGQERKEVTPSHVGAVSGPGSSRLRFFIKILGGGPSGPPPSHAWRSAKNPRFRKVAKVRSTSPLCLEAKAPWAEKTSAGCLLSEETGRQSQSRRQKSHAESLASAKRERGISEKTYHRTRGRPNVTHREKNHAKRRPRTVFSIGAASDLLSLFRPSERSTRDDIRPRIADVFDQDLPYFDRCVDRDARKRPGDVEHPGEGERHPASHGTDRKRRATHPDRGGKGTGRVFDLAFGVGDYSDRKSVV